MDKKYSLNLTENEQFRQLSISETANLLSACTPTPPSGQKKYLGLAAKNLTALPGSIDCNACLSAGRTVHVDVKFLGVPGAQVPAQGNLTVKFTHKDSGVDLDFATSYACSSSYSQAHPRYFGTRNLSLFALPLGC